MRRAAPPSSRKPLSSIWRLAALACIWCAWGCSDPAPAPSDPPLDTPNSGVTSQTVPDSPTSVVMLTIDTWRADHFNEKHTPNLWNTAATGLRVTTAWSPIGLTSPALATMFTGMPPWKHGMRGNNHHGYEIYPNVGTTAENALKQGRATAAFVSAYPAGPAGGMDQGFQSFDGPESGERPGAVAVERARAWLAEQGPTTPVYLWVHVYEPHGPYQPDPLHLEALGFPADSTSDVERYAAEVHQADAILAPLLDEIERRPNTAVVIAGDHGEVLLEETCGRQHERSTHPVVLQVPLVFRGPGLPAGTFDTPLSIDLVERVVRTWLSDEPYSVDTLTMRAERPYFRAESGICESDCAPGCSPDGLMGRDRVAHRDGWRLIERPGKGRWAEGVDAPPEEEWSRYLNFIPAMTSPTRSPEQDRVKALGYSE